MNNFDDNNTNFKVVFDIETTGFKPEDGAEIIELAGIKINEESKIVGRFHAYIKPSNPIPEKITELTGITNEMVKDSFEVEEVLKGFVAFVDDATLVAHYSNFDVDFINYYLVKHGIRDEYLTSICTQKSFRNYYKGASSAKLIDCCNHFEIVLENAHSAMFDCSATYELYKALSNNNSIVENRHHLAVVDPSEEFRTQISELDNNISALYRERKTAEEDRLQELYSEIRALQEEKFKLYNEEGRRLREAI